MNLNNCEHDDWVVIYNGFPCPVCDMEQEIADLQDRIEELEK